MVSFGQYDCNKLGNLPNFLLDFWVCRLRSTVLFASKWSYFGSFFTMGSDLLLSTPLLKPLLEIWCQSYWKNDSHGFYEEVGGGGPKRRQLQGLILSMFHQQPFFLQWRVKHADDQDCKAATQYIDAGAHGGAGWCMRKDWLASLNPWLSNSTHQVSSNMKDNKQLDNEMSITIMTVASQ